MQTGHDGQRTRSKELKENEEQILRSRMVQRPLWSIAKDENGRMEMLTVDHHGEEQTLPVFSYEQQALAFLNLQTPGKGWQPKKTTPGELVSVLHSLCARVKKVALDPPPTPINTDEEINELLVGVDWRRFVRDLIRGEGGMPGLPSMDPEQTYVPDYVMWDFGGSFLDSGDSGEDDLEEVWPPWEEWV